jgi:hypothetical protein
MSYSVDANLFLYASDSSNPYHARAAVFLKRCMANPELWYLTWPTLMAYLRISTHPSIFAHPLSPDEAMENVEKLLVLPHVRVLAETRDFWNRYRVLADTTPVRGNLVPDAHVAALLKSHGIIRIFSNDRDFRKFPGLEVIDPLTDPNFGT